ncbi:MULTISPECIES: polyphenol oxidase family protein [unclassified Nocardioides]|uniref:polyphenol oxidase family protein n=1 Tax=unclassified Nocardioides TaxID=2615069 RepID=UPI0036219E15
MYYFADSIGSTVEGDVRLDVAFTDSSLDLQGLGPEFPRRLAEVEGACGVPFARLTQVHGAEVQIADGPMAPDAVPTGDALVTTRRGLGLMVRVADCVPVLLADPKAGVIGAVHAGRPGMALGIVTAAVDAMRAQGAGTVRAWVGPHVCGRCYEVPAEMRDEVAALVPESRSETSWGSPALDLGAGVEAQLVAAGAEVTRVDGCTREDARLHSYRRDGAAAGRFAGLVWLT